MANQWFYGDPLEVLWMAKNFGMEFEDEKGKSLGPRKDFRHKSFDDMRKLAMRYYVHPGSVYILKPQEKDLGYIPDCGYTVFSEDCGGWLPLNFELPSPAIVAISAVAEIIQRNNIPFMWPKKKKNESS